MATRTTILCVLLQLAALATLGAAIKGTPLRAAAAAPAPSAATRAAAADACNNATHHSDPLVAYFLTGKDLTVKVLKQEARGVVAQLSTKAADLAPVMPFIIHAGDIIRHGMLGTARFIGDFQELHAEAAQQGRYAHAGAAAAAQCFAKYGQSALDYVKGERKEVPTMEVPSNAVLFTAAHPDQAAVLDILDGRVEGDTVTLTVLLVDEPQLEPEGRCHLRQSETNGYHYHFPIACSATRLALDFVLPSAGGQGDAAVPGAFSLHIKLACVYFCD